MTGYGGGTKSETTLSAQHEIAGRYDLPNLEFEASVRSECQVHAVNCQSEVGTLLENGSRLCFFKFRGFMADYMMIVAVRPFPDKIFKVGSFCYAKHART